MKSVSRPAQRPASLCFVKRFIKEPFRPSGSDIREKTNELLCAGRGRLQLLNINEITSSRAAAQVITGLLSFNSVQSEHRVTT